MVRGIGIAWAVFILGIAAIFGLDYGLRMADGNVRSGGLGEPLYFGAAAAVGGVSLLLLYRATAQVSVPWKRWVVLIACVALAWILYAVAALFYVIHAQIDSL